MFFKKAALASLACLVIAGCNNTNHQCREFNYPIDKGRVVYSKQHVVSTLHRYNEINLDNPDKYPISTTGLAFDF